MIMEYITLNNGVKCPAAGIGTFMLSPAEAENSVREALKMGYRLVDTANAYVNERAVGRGMRESGAAREEIFLSTKLWPSEYENENAVDETLERLGVDYVDLLYIHQPAGNWMAGYRQLEKAFKEGKAKSIGISNFEGEFIEELQTKWEIVPQFIQVEAHPYFTQQELRRTLDQYGIRLMSWYPLGHGDKSLIEEPVFAKLGQKYGKSPAQVILRWHTRGDPRQQKRGSHQGQPGYHGFPAYGRRNGGGRKAGPGRALLPPDGRAAEGLRRVAPGV